MNRFGLLSLMSISSYVVHSTKETQISIWVVFQLKKVIIELPLSTQCLTRYRRRLTWSRYWFTLFSLTWNSGGPNSLSDAIVKHQQQQRNAAMLHHAASASSNAANDSHGPFSAVEQQKRNGRSRRNSQAMSLTANDASTSGQKTPSQRNVKTTKGGEESSGQEKQITENNRKGKKRLRLFIYE